MQHSASKTTGKAQSTIAIHTATSDFREDGSRHKIHSITSWSAGIYYAKGLFRISGRGTQHKGPRLADTKRCREQMKRHIVRQFDAQAWSLPTHSTVTQLTHLHVNNAATKHSEQQPNIHRRMPGMMKHRARQLHAPLGMKNQNSLGQHRLGPDCLRDVGKTGHLPSLKGGRYPPGNPHSARGRKESSKLDTFRTLGALARCIGRTGSTQLPSKHKAASPFATSGAKGGRIPPSMRHHEDRQNFFQC